MTKVLSVIFSVQLIYNYLISIFSIRAMFSYFVVFHFTLSTLQTCQLSFDEMVHTQQVDIATFIGLSTGSGIPSSSLGALPAHWLFTFWNTTMSQLMVISDLMKHIASLSGCSYYKGMTTSFVKSLEVDLLNPQCSSSVMSPEHSELYIFPDFPLVILRHLEYQFAWNTW